MTSFRDKIVDLHFIQRNPDIFKVSKVVFTNGCFDLLHPGHIHYLEQANALGDILIVGINDDASVERLKGQQRPINSLQVRSQMLAGLSSVDYVIAFSEDDPLNLIKGIDPDVLVKGGDYTTETIVGAEEVMANGGIVKSLDLLEGYSSTNLIERIQNLKL